MLWLSIFWLLLLDPPRYLQPYHLPSLPDVVSFRFFTHAAEYLVRISIVFQEIAHDSPDILTWGTTPDRGFIQEVGEFIDQRIADRLACKLVYLTHDDGCFLPKYWNSLFALLWNARRGGQLCTNVMHDWLQDRLLATLWHSIFQAHFTKAYR